MRKTAAIGAIAVLELAASQSMLSPASAADCTAAPTTSNILIVGTRYTLVPGTWTNGTNFKAFTMARDAGDGQSNDYGLFAYSEHGLTWYDWTFGSTGNSFGGTQDTGEVKNANINTWYFTYKRSC